MKNWHLSVPIFKNLLWGKNKMKKFPIRHKYHAKKTIRDGIRFDSKKEAEYYDMLQAKQAAGIVLFFLRQVPFHLPGQTTYRVDFQVFYREGYVEFIDVKGVETEVFKLKKRQVEALYPVEILVV